MSVKRTDVPRRGPSAACLGRQAVVQRICEVRRVSRRACVQYLLLALAFNVIALLLPTSGVVAASPHGHLYVSAVLLAAAVFNA